jgi:Flp pilus assembly protein TadG
MIKDQRGATAVEFGIVLFLLILVVFGTIEFGLLLFNKHIITNASREGARAGVVARMDRFEDGDLVDIKEDHVKPWLAHLVTFGETVPLDDMIAVEIRDEIVAGGCQDETNFHEIDDEEYSWVDPCTGFEDPLRVTVTYDYDFLVLSMFFGPVRLVSTSVMGME